MSEAEGIAVRNGVKPPTAGTGAKHGCLASGERLSGEKGGDRGGTYVYASPGVDCWYCWYVK